MSNIVPLSPELLALLNSGQLASAMPFTREIFLLNITVAGTSHCEKIEELEPQIQVGTVLRMLRHPQNEYDHKAIGIYLGNDRVGYVPQDLNLIISRLMDAGKAFICRVTDKKWKGAWLRIRADISMIE